VPQTTDYLLSKAPSIVGGQPVTPQSQERSLPIPTPAPLPPPSEPEATPFERALANELPRMAKFKLSTAFVRGVLVPGAELELGEVAMRWAGMPNKHERALTNDVLDALASAGYLEHLEPERYRVSRAADS